MQLFLRLKRRIPKRNWYKESTTKYRNCPESLGAMLEYWYIEPGIVDTVHNAYSNIVTTAYQICKSQAFLETFIFKLTFFYLLFEAWSTLLWEMQREISILLENFAVILIHLHLSFISELFSICIWKDDVQFYIFARKNLPRLFSFFKKGNFSLVV